MVIAVMDRQQRQAIVIAATVFVTLFVVWGGGGNTAGIFFPDILKSFGWSRAKLSTITTAGALVGGLCIPLIGWLLDRIEARIVMAVGATMVALAFLAGSRVHSYHALLTCHVIAAVGMGGTAFLPAAFVISNWFPERRRGMAMALTFSGSSLGGAGMTQVASYFVRHGGWRSGYVGISLPMLLLMVPAILIFIRSRPPSEDALENARPASVGDAIASLSGVELRDAFRTRSFWMICLAHLFFGFAVIGLGLHLVAYLTDTGYTAAAAANVVSLIFIMMTMGKLTTGTACDYVSPRRVLAVVFTSGGLGVALLMGAGKVPMMLGAFVLFNGVAAAAPTVLLPMVTVESLGLKRLGSVLGIASLFSTLGAAVGPVIAGRIYDVTGSYHLALMMFATFWVAAALATLGCLKLETEQTRLTSSGTGLRPALSAAK